MTRFKRWLIAILCMLILSGSWSQAAPRYDAQSDLLTDDLDNLLAPPQQPDAKRQKPSVLPGNPTLDDLLRDRMPGGSLQPHVGEDVGQPQENPLDQIQQTMQQARNLIDRRDQTGETGRVQQKIIDDLDKLIKKMEQQCQGGQCNNQSQSQQQQQQSKRSQPKPAGKSSKQASASASSSSSSAQQSTARLSSASAADAQQQSTEQLLKEAWGHLPQRLREQMLQSSSDEFLPKYRDEIQQYFKRLADEAAQQPEN